MGFKLDKDATPEIEALIFLKHYNNELSTYQYVVDRSMVDIMAYAGWVLDNRPRTKEMAIWEECERLAERRLRSAYTHVFYLPIEFPIVLDGLRPDDTGFQADIDGRIRGLLEGEDVPYLTLTGSIPERSEQVRRAVGVEVGRAP